MAKEIEVSDNDYGRLYARAGDGKKIKPLITKLLDLADIAEKDVKKWEDWMKATNATNMRLDPLKTPQSKESGALL